MTRSFSKDSWLRQLQEVHRWAWQKWDLVRATYPLSDASSEQLPGEILPDVVQGLQPIIAAMGKKRAGL